MKININENVDDTTWNEHKISVSLLKKIIKSTIKLSGKEVEKVILEILYTDESYIKIINKKFRNKDKSTNVISSGSINCPQGFLIGEIIFSFGNIQQESLEQNKSFQDHLVHLCIHGLLHIMEYDHIEENQAEEMESLEIKILEIFKIKNPY